jgi:hypothetical protein
MDAGELLPLPKEFQRHALHSFRKYAGQRTRAAITLTRGAI